MPKVSVIIPVYNVEKYLRECLDSVINQTLKDIEIICIDDGSTDNSLSILKEYAKKDKRIKVINQENKGLSGARNTGIENATGEFIGFVDSDDWIDSNFYENLYNTAITTNSDIACAPIKRVYGNKIHLRLKIESEQLATTLQEKFDILNIPRCCYVWNKIYRSSKLLKHNIRFEQGKYFEDVPFSIDIISKLNNIIAVPGAFYYYRANPNSIVNTLNNFKRMDHIWAKDYMLNFVKENNIKIPFKLQLKKKHKFTIFGITILKVYEWETEKHYKLFGIIPILKKITF